MMKIPRIFHQIWLGRQPMPIEFLEWQKTWTSLNPSWTLKLWTEDNLPDSRWPDLVKGTEPRPGGPAAGTPHAERICDAFATHLRRTCADSLLRGQQTLDGRS